MNPDPEGQPARGSMILGEFSVSSAPGNEREAAERVAAMVRQTDLPPARLEELKTSVAEAVLNAMEHGNQYRPDLPVRVRVIVSGEALVVRSIFELTRLNEAIRIYEGETEALAAVDV